MAEPVVFLDSIEKVFGAGAAQVQALNNIDLSMGQNEFVSLIVP